MNETAITSASIKVMRSYDYCHFEVNLSASGPLTTSEVDDLRKEAARLADKAVKQYKTAKRIALLRDSDQRSMSYSAEEYARIKAMPESEWTPEDKAEVKAQDDRAFRINRPRYDYQDEWDDGDGRDDDDQEF